MQNLLPFLPIAFLAESVGTITGFGTSTILVPIVSFFIPIREAIVIVSVFHLFGTIARTAVFRGGINWKIAVLFGIPSLIFSVIGASFLNIISADLLTKILGLALILYALMSLFGKALILPKNNLTLIIGGTAGGFLAGLIGTAGALRSAFLTSWKLKKEVYLGTGAVMGLGADLARVLVYKNSGLIWWDQNFTILLIITAILGTLVGRRIVKLFPEEIFRKIILAGLLLAGLRFLL